MARSMARTIQNQTERRVSSLPRMVIQIKYAKGGDLRFNESIIFYMKGTDVTVIPPAAIRGIKTEIVGNKGSETNFVCVYYEKGILKIKTSEKNVLLLLEEMRKTFA